MHPEYLKEFTEEHGGTFYSSYKRGLADAVIILENEQQEDRRLLQGTAITIAQPRLILHHRWPQDKALAGWTSAFGVPMASCDLAETVRHELQQQFYSIAVSCIPEFPMRAAQDDLVLPVRARYTAAQIRQACKVECNSEHPVVAVVSKNVATVPFFEEFDRPSDNSRSLSYIVIEQAGQVVRKA